MNLSVFIARRYLFSKKKQNAINVISLVSVVGVAVGTAALVVVLSVFNGIDLVLGSALDRFTPDVLITPQKGKFFSPDSMLLERLRATREISSYDMVVEEKALVKYGEHFLPITLKGVEQTYGKHTGIEEAVVIGRFVLQEDEIWTASVGSGIAAALRLRIGTITPLVLYYPDKNATNMLTALVAETIFPTSVFSAQQEMDGKYVMADIEFARRLFGVPGKVSHVEIRLKDADDIAKVKENLLKEIGEQYNVEDKYTINRSFYAMMKSEKLAVFVILLFILFIASFNIVGSVAMLILDKKENIGVFCALGMRKEKIVSIFKLEANFITGIGAFLGLGVGSVLCLLQEHYGLIMLGEGSYMIEAYPVKLIVGDVMLILLAVSLIGFIASHFPVKYLINRIIKS